MLGEIQVNTPAMIYAKETESVAREILGDDVYNRIASRTSVLGRHQDASGKCHSVRCFRSRSNRNERIA
jgi:hypothetical protein